MCQKNHIWVFLLILLVFSRKHRTLEFYKRFKTIKFQNNNYRVCQKELK